LEKFLSEGGDSTGIHEGRGTSLSRGKGKKRIKNFLGGAE